MEVAMPTLINAKTGEETEDEKLVKPRPYQELMKDVCIRKNTIVYLPTGAGKTYIAILVIKHYAKDLERPLCEGGKRTIFVVNTVALARQQAEVLRKRFPPEMVGLYSGDMNVDNWKKDKWREEFEKNKIVVATVQIIVDVITSGYLSIADINVLIIDECHSGKGDHPMHQLMSKFQHVPDKSKHPRVIGLTGILMRSVCNPNQVEDQLVALENTYHSTIATVENLQEYNAVMEYSTDPVESVIRYRPLASPQLLQHIRDEIEALIQVVESYRLDNLKNQKAKTLKQDAPSKVKEIRSLLKDLLYQMEDLGIYGGSIAILGVLVELELSKRQAESKAEQNLFRIAIAHCDKIRRLLVQFMDCDDLEHNKLAKFGSPKLSSLVAFLNNYVEKDEKIAKELKCLVFVQRRHSAKVIYHILQRISLENTEENQEPRLRPDFMVGNRNYLPESIEQILSEKNSRKVIERFRKNEINVIVCSSVLEEGIDLQSCNLVIRYDNPTTFSSYVQTKGRARMKNSQYVLMIDSLNSSKILENIEKYKLVEKKLKQCLVGKTINRKPPDEAEISKELYNELIPPFITKAGASLNALSALQLLNRYAMLMPHDRFTNTSVYWERVDEFSPYTTKVKYKVKLYLPMQSTIKEPIESKEWESLKLAKRHAAFLACKQLYENGELTDHLMPIDTVKKIENLQDQYFLHWENFSQDNAKLAGTKQLKRSHDLTYADELSGCTPTLSNTCYLYIIRNRPNFLSNIQYEQDNARVIFHELLANENGYAILTAKKIPQLPSMRFYMTFGEIHTNIAHEPIEMVLTSDEQLKILFNFHAMLFRDLLGIKKSYLLHDFKRGENSFLIVPVKGTCINWETAQMFQRLNECHEKSERERRYMNFLPQDYLHKVITPCHKTNPTKYIVTRVCEDLNPNSPFPYNNNNNFDSYAEYFKLKYDKNVIHHNQFLLETRAITSGLSFLYPKESFDGVSKKNVDRTEVYIPELCHNHRFSGDLWLKALLIPSTLHRLSKMLVGEKLRICINSSLGLSLNPSTLMLDVDQIDDSANSKKRLNDDFVGDEDSSDENEAVMNINMPVAPITFPNPDDTKPIHIDNALESLTDQFASLWNLEEEPLDIERHWDTVHDIDLDYYMNFVTRNFENSKVTNYIEQHGMLGSGLVGSPSKKFKAIKGVPTEEKFNIDLLDIKQAKAPELKDVLRALTASSAADVFNLERFELLGDSFLKFAVSLYLICKHQDWHEGYLSGLKGRIVSNRNLFYIGNKHQLPGMLNLFKFDPKNDWIPPLFCIPPNIKEYMCESNISAHYLWRSVRLSDEEVEKGSIKPEHEIRILHELQKQRNTDLRDGSSKTLLGQQYVGDKSVADCVESIIGVYLHSTGIQKCFNLLHILSILPNDNVLNNVLSIPMDSHMKSSASIDEIDSYLLNYKHLERALGYTFKDRSYLLQALTHPSYPTSKYGCYQQLEFVGDAVLDFLISSYIFEKCGRMDPGELTDLRSALVNNNTLACISVRNKFHMHILSQNALLDETIAKFVDYQKNNGHECTDQVELLVTENDKMLADFVDVPKVLGDIFESLIGAVFFDSGKNLQITWKVIYSLMYNEIYKFMSCVPKQLVRRLYEYQPAAYPKFGPVKVHDNFVQLALQYTCKNQVLEVFGFGQNKDDAKKAAAKAALQTLERAHGRHVMQN